MFWERWTTTQVEQLMGLVLLSNSPIHLNISIWTSPSTWAENKTYFSNTFPISFSFRSTSLNHSLSMHSVHFLQSLDLERPTLVVFFLGITLDDCTPRLFLCSTGTQNRGSLSRPTTHPSVMSQDINSYPWTERQCSSVRCVMSHILKPESREYCANFVPSRINTMSALLRPKILAYRWPV